MISKKYFKQRFLRILLGHKFVDKIIFTRNYYKFGNKLLWPNLKKGERFNEKMLYMKHFQSAKLNSDLVDKFKVRKIVADMIGEEYLIKLYGVWGASDVIDISLIPGKCVLKTNHISGDVKIITNQGQISDAIDSLKALLKYDYYNYGGEPQYRGISPVILAEELLGNGMPIKDYKFFCFDGIPKYIQVDMDRFTNHTRTFFTLEWNNLRFSTLYPVYDGNIPKPINLHKMIELASTLSRGFTFVRVDLYEVEGKVYFGELTFHHGGGFEPFYPDKFDVILGRDLNLKV